MKNLIKAIAFCIIIYTLSTSCEDMFGDFLEKAPGVDVTEDTIFSSVVQAERAIATVYYYCTHTIYPYVGGYGTDGWFGATTDEGECVAWWFQPSQINNGNAITPGWNRDWRWGDRNKGSRYSNIVIKKIVEVPDADQAYKDQVIAEMKFLRALNNFYTFIHYGGIPLVLEAFEVGQDYGLERSTVEETVNAIVQDCDEAVPYLPHVQPDQYKGRATKAAAMMLKSRVLLYAASPLFNTGSTYMDLPGHNNLICYGNYDVNRWQKAADAAKAVIDYAPSAGIELITDKGVDKNYQYNWVYPDNKETIFLVRKQGRTDNTAMAFFMIGARPIYSGLGGNTGSLNFLQMYEKRDGTPVNWDLENGGEDLIEKYESMDYRFKQSFAYSGGYWNEDYPYLEMWQGGRHYAETKGGTWMMKGIYPYMTRANKYAWIEDPTFRLNEAYLNYAEALNEAQGPVPAAHNAINTIRNRSGQPDLPLDISKEDFRKKIRNERAIELLNEEHRMWDLRRWLLAESTTYGGMNGPLWGMRVYKISDDPLRCRYEPYVMENRVFPRREYLYPWKQAEVYKGYVIQNPGY